MNDDLTPIVFNDIGGKETDAHITHTLFGP